MIVAVHRRYRSAMSERHAPFDKVNKGWKPPDRAGCDVRADIIAGVLAQFA